MEPGKPFPVPLGFRAKKGDQMRRFILVVFMLGLMPTLLFAQYTFNFSCISDTVQTGSDVITFYFSLINTGTLPDSYAFDCRVVDSVPGWFEIYCVRGVCVEPGTVLYDYLNVGQADSLIDIIVYPTPGYAVEILNLHVQSIGNPSLKDSINVHATGTNAVEETEKIDDMKIKDPKLTICPNPFSKLTNISFGIGYAAKGIEIMIYGATGRLIKNFSIPAVPSLLLVKVIWDGTDNFGKIIPAGVYFVRLKCLDFVSETKIILVR
jgi:hypothetical protein